MLRVLHARLLSCVRSYSRWNVLPQVEMASREARAPPPPLPSPKYLEIRRRCTIEYVDIPPLNEAVGSHSEDPVTLVLVHGAPGSYSDFRHLIPKLNRPYMRILGLNLPGYAGSRVSEEHYLDSISALPTADLALEAVQKLCDSGNVFLVGHSFGAHTVINMAALETHEKFRVRGMALLAPAGCRPHKVLRPRESAMVVSLLRRDNAVLSTLTSHLIKAIYTRLLKFPSDHPPGHYIAGLVRAGTTDFNVIREQVDMLRKRKMPSLVAWSQNDEFMEEEIPVELARLCHPGPRLKFARGGHNVQKTRADQIADALSRWIEEVLDKEGRVN
ncbi:serine protease family S33, putative [Phytophthora infestans T30-4]|uniref:Serine protease family S33, putative n=1 Tax=Phytophthora infestans (strain T30-4) TaxID=403677 RepID=D0N4X1_PHYIT|nr:serine protease family S33, putative [Phytophthora infestans T30-4]EEY69929.1 serine protease family S33, putative [Phytophthora infestans T30-4]|eukprot:XP_002998576.1 serine protease family S33, putative [Phytophthora infestans T30-4]